MPAHCFAGRQDPDGGDCPDRLGGSLGRLLLTAEEVPEGCDYMVDSTLFPAGTGATAAIGRGERGCAGMSAQTLVLLEGGSRGHPTPIRAPCMTWPPRAPSGPLGGIDPSGWIADKGYVGRGMITSHKKPPNGELSEAAKEANRSANRIRQVVERTIYRRPLHAFEQTITAALYITFYVFKTTP